MQSYNHYSWLFVLPVDFVPPHDGKKKISIAVLIGAVVVVLLLIFMILGILWWKGCLGGRSSRENGNLCKS